MHSPLIYNFHAVVNNINKVTTKVQPSKSVATRNIVNTA